MKRLLCSLLGLLCTQVFCECGCSHSGNREDAVRHLEGGEAVQEFCRSHTFSEGMGSVQGSVDAQ